MRDKFAQAREIKDAREAAIQNSYAEAARRLRVAWGSSDKSEEGLAELVQREIGQNAVLGPGLKFYAMRLLAQTVEPPETKEKPEAQPA